MFFVGQEPVVHVAGLELAGKIQIAKNKRTRTSTNENEIDAWFASVRVKYFISFAKNLNSWTLSILVRSALLPTHQLPPAH